MVEPEDSKIKNENQVELSVEETPDLTYEASTEKAEFIFENVISELITYFESQRKMAAAAALRSNECKLVEGNVIIESVKHEHKMFEELRLEILQFLRSKLALPALQVSFVVVQKSKKEAKPFTGKDKLNAMVAKNPLLKDLFDTFHLELED